MNPLFRDPTQPIAFDKIKIDHIHEACERVMEECQQLRTEILASPVDDKQGRLIKLDDMEAKLDFVLSPIYLLKEVHPDDNLRKACQQVVETLFNFDNKMDLDEELYQSLKAFSENPPHLSPVEARLLKERMDHYLRNGFQLDAPERDELQKIDEKITSAELLFQKNIAGSEVALQFSEAEMEGLPDDFKEERYRQDGSYYRVTTQYPDFYPMMRLAQNEGVRKQLFMAFNTRAKEGNLPLLRELLELRRERSLLLGFPNYAAFQLGDKMAGDPQTVRNFIDELAEKVSKKANHDHQILCDFQKNRVLFPWNKLFVTTAYKAAQFELDDEIVKTYFPLDQVLEGLFEVAQTLYSVSFVEQDLPTWHSAVRGFEVREQGKVLGRFYLDLFPRPNKFGHAACFGIQSGKQYEHVYSLPCAALVCNLPKPPLDKPCLLTHEEVQTIFHEFGHLLHMLLTTSPFIHFAGTSVARDFVEMPSQIFENWIWEKEVLQRFAKHYDTGEAIPDDLLDKMLAVKQLNSGINTQQQLLFGSLDLTFHDGFESDDDDDTTRIYQSHVHKYLLMPAVEGACMQTSFGHLVGYAAGYYGYLWSKVYAIDMFSVFKEKGIFDPVSGARLRNEVLALGSTEDPMVLIERFLGRKPNMDAFLANLGI